MGVVFLQRVGNVKLVSALPLAPVFLGSARCVCVGLRLSFAAAVNFIL